MIVAVAPAAWRAVAPRSARRTVLPGTLCNVPLPAADGLAQLPVAPLGVDARRLQFAVAKMACRRLQIMRLSVQARPGSMAQRVYAFCRHRCRLTEVLHVAPGAPGRPIRQDIAIVAAWQGLQRLAERRTQGYHALLAALAMTHHQVASRHVHIGPL